jgi:hypothetical protein
MAGLVLARLTKNQGNTTRRGGCRDAFGSASQPDQTPPFRILDEYIESIVRNWRPRSAATDSRPGTASFGSGRSADGVWSGSSKNIVAGDPTPAPCFSAPTPPAPESNDQEPFRTARHDGPVGPSNTRPSEVGITKGGGTAESRWLKNGQGRPLAGGSTKESGERALDNKTAALGLARRLAERWRYNGKGSIEGRREQPTAALSPALNAQGTRKRAPLWSSTIERHDRD